LLAKELVVKETMSAGEVLSLLDIPDLTKVRKD
jgi:hypothetical protein